MFWKLALTVPLFLAALPSTTNYELNSYGFGSGGTANSSTGNYSLEGITGEISGQTSATSTYTQKPGFNETQQANVPKITLTNPSNYYDKLHFLIDQQNNPTDALYAIQVKVNDATCDFTTGTIDYIQSDDTLGSSLVTADYQTYAAWGGSSGQNMIGLSSSTNYCIRAKATQGQFTESAYGPSSSAATVGQQISFCLWSGGSCGSSSNATAFSGLVAGSISSATNNLNLTLTTNADNGGNVYVYSTGKLQSATHVGGTITSVTGTSPVDLTSLSSGYGAQVSTASGLTIQSPYNGSGSNVGQLSTIINTLLAASSPIASGSATIQLQAKAANTTPAATDYADIVTVIAAANF